MSVGNGPGRAGHGGRVAHMLLMTVMAIYRVAIVPASAVTLWHRTLVVHAPRTAVGHPPKGTQWPQAQIGPLMRRALCVALGSLFPTSGEDTYSLFTKHNGSLVFTLYGLLAIIHQRDHPLEFIVMVLSHALRTSAISGSKNKHLLYNSNSGQ